MKRYPLYKDSKVKWIGNVPEHWKTVPFGSGFRYFKGLSITKADLLPEGTPVISYGQIHSKGSEIAEQNGKKVQFLEAAKATRVNELHYTDEESLRKFKVYYEFLHARRNEESHAAPEIPDEQVKLGVHMSVAMYLYATIINLRRMRSAGLPE